MNRIIYATIKLTVKDSADVDEITSEANYNFEHSDILDTEWIATMDGQERQVSFTKEGGV